MEREEGRREATDATFVVLLHSDNREANVGSQPLLTHEDGLVFDATRLDTVDTPGEAVVELVQVSNDADVRLLSALERLCQFL